MIIRLTEKKLLRESGTRLRESSTVLLRRVNQLMRFFMP
jgi:hypothetical protein